MFYLAFEENLTIRHRLNKPFTGNGYVYCFYVNKLKDVYELVSFVNENFINYDYTLESLKLRIKIDTFILLLEKTIYKNNFEELLLVKRDLEKFLRKFLNYDKLLSSESIFEMILNSSENLHKKIIFM